MFNSPAFIWKLSLSLLPFSPPPTDKRICWN